MLDIHNLEHRWLKYKIKSYLPHAVFVFFTVLLLFTASVWVWPKKTTSPHLSQSKTKLPVQNLSAVTKKPAVPQNDTVILEPSMEFVQALNERERASEISSETPNVQTVKSATHVAVPLPPPPVPKELLLPESQPVAAKIQSPQSSKTMLSVNRNESPLDIVEVQQRFKESSNPTLGLFIARYYYDHGNYSEAYNYALKTNAINSHIDESWIIFSKSLVKLGKTDQAKKTLQLYISQSGSDTAKTLLDIIEKGNFK